MTRLKRLTISAAVASGESNSRTADWKNGASSSSRNPAKPGNASGKAGRSPLWLGAHDGDDRTTSGVQTRSGSAANGGRQPCEGLAQRLGGILRLGVALYSDDQNGVIAPVHRQHPPGPIERALAHRVVAAADRCQSLAARATGLSLSASTAAAYDRHYRLVISCSTTRRTTLYAIAYGCSAGRFRGSVVGWHSSRSRLARGADVAAR